MSDRCPRLARATVLLLAVALAGCESPSPTPSSASISPSALAATSSVTPAPSTTVASQPQPTPPGPTASPTSTPIHPGPSPISEPAGPDGWTLVTSGGGYFRAVWAPDGAHFFNGQEPTPIEVRDASGSLLTSYAQFDRVAWLDPSHLLGYRDTVGDPETAVASIADLKGSVVAAPEALNATAGDGLPNGLGAVAMPRVVGSGDVPHYQFAVWSDGALGDWHEGEPAEWSDDGTKLAVYHPFEFAMGDPGWLEVLSWPGLTRLYADRPPYADVYTVDFDPSGNYIAAYGGGGPAKLHGAQLRIVSLATDTSAQIPLDSVTYPADPDFFWTTGSQLSLMVGGRVDSYDTSGKRVDERIAPGFLANASPDGSTVAFISDSIGNIDIEKDGRLVSSSQFGSGGISQPWFSPDGRSLLLYGYLPDGSTGLFLKRL